MWTLIAEQLRYRRRGLLVTGLLAFAFGSTAPLVLDPSLRHARLWMLLLLLVGGAVNLYLWTLDQKERRVLLWSALPVPRAHIAAARLVSPLVIQGALLGICLLGAGAGALLEPGAGLDPMILRLLLGAQGYVLLSMAFVLLHEETMLRAASFPWGVTLTNVAGVVFFGFVTYLSLTYFEAYETWTGIALMHLLSAAFGAMAYVLFVRRGDMLTGVNALTGCPENWSGRAR